MMHHHVSTRGCCRKKLIFNYETFKIRFPDRDFPQRLNLGKANEKNLQKKLAIFFAKMHERKVACIGVSYSNFN